MMSNTAERNIEMLHPYYTYSFVISAVTIGPGPPSAVHNVITAEEGNLTNSFGKIVPVCSSHIDHTLRTYRATVVLQR